MSVFKVVCLGQQNDHKALMKRIETLLPQVLPSQNKLNSYSFDNMRIGSTDFLNLEPFAIIGVVPTASQAFKAVYRNRISFFIYYCLGIMYE